ncbi:transcription antitermination protein [Halopelagius longus]|uniref:Transcription antitermination protein n=1 Tax=Halopelagius longus TaxID=1236180 RepID=A0A1H1EN84_9EURY|nr:transcription antitermination protein [Halopelagius longus]RDI71817.1 transcription antitermination protein [Halopelagius longus]SDQ89969.1 hypothetical protein SAMN05216278_2978 [Halopelagius longus]
MNGQDLADELRDDHETPFSRLGSSKALYALTGGEMDAGPVRAAAADDARSLASVLDEWAADEDDDAAASLYEELAATARDHADSVAPDDHERGETPETDARLAEFEDTVPRLGGLLGRYLVAQKHVEQMVGFFVGDADPRTASEFRDLRGDVEDARDRVAAALDETCEGDDDWDVARDAADAVVEGAYDEYVETLESMGVKPKNVC